MLPKEIQPQNKDALPTPAFKTDNPLIVDAALTPFIDTLNAGKLDEIFNVYKKPDSPFAHLVAQKHKQRRVSITADHPGLKFYLDGDHTILIGKEQERDNPLWFGEIGFIAGNRLGTYNRERHESLGNDSIVVVQIQGPNKPAEDSTPAQDKAHALFQSYRTEAALLRIPIEWAKLVGLSAVYVLPADKNSWKPKDKSSEKMQRLKLRYDVTARRLGFKLTPDGLYKLTV